MQKTAVELPVLDFGAHGFPTNWLLWLYSPGPTDASLLMTKRPNTVNLPDRESKQRSLLVNRRLADNKVGSELSVW